MHLLTQLGVKVRLFGPRTLLPKGVHNWPATVYDDMNKAVKDADAVMCLRLQLERQQAGLLPDLSEYASRFCLQQKHLDMAAPGAPVLHPGPVNRGLEISSDLADAPMSRILDQVSVGVAVRMAVLFTLGMRNEAA
jgi:aspartate carbamoyltransferase catalytic subunit